MEIKDQEETYTGFLKIGVRATVAILAVVAFLAMFVA